MKFRLQLEITNKSLAKIDLSNSEVYSTKRNMVIVYFMIFQKQISMSVHLLLLLPCKLVLPVSSPVPSGLGPGFTRTKCKVIGACDFQGCLAADVVLSVMVPTHYAGPTCWTIARVYHLVKTMPKEIILYINASLCGRLTSSLMIGIKL